MAGSGEFEYTLRLASKLLLRCPASFQVQKARITFYHRYLFIISVTLKLIRIEGTMSLWSCSRIGSNSLLGASWDSSKIFWFEASGLVASGTSNISGHSIIISLQNVRPNKILELELDPPRPWQWPRTHALTHRSLSREKCLQCIYIVLYLLSLSYPRDNSRSPFNRFPTTH